MRRLPPRREAPPAPVSKAPGLGDLLKAVVGSALGSRPGGHKWVAETALHMANPAYWRVLQNVERHGKKVQPSEVMSALRRTLDPTWEGPTSGDRLAAALLQASKYPASAAGGLLGARGGPVGAAAGKTAGWMLPDILSSYYTPETANRSALLDVAEYAGGKALGTVGSRAYRSLLQPTLASKGLLSKAAHPVLGRVIPMAEKILLEPATGPGAPEKPVGIPKRMGKWLRSKGPQGLEPEAAFRAAQARKIPWTGETQEPLFSGYQQGLQFPAAEWAPRRARVPPSVVSWEQGFLGLPRQPSQLGVPGMTPEVLAAARMRGHGLPQYPGGAVSVSPPGLQEPLTFPSYQLPLPGGSSVRVIPAVPKGKSPFYFPKGYRLGGGAVPRPAPQAGPGVPQIDMALQPGVRQGTLGEVFESLPMVPERVPLVGEVRWYEWPAEFKEFSTGKEAPYAVNFFTQRLRPLKSDVLGISGRTRYPLGLGTGYGIRSHKFGESGPKILRGKSGNVIFGAAGLGISGLSIGSEVRAGRREEKALLLAQKNNEQKMKQRIRERRDEVRRIQERSRAGR